MEPIGTTRELSLESPGGHAHQMMMMGDMMMMGPGGGAGGMMGTFPGGQVRQEREWLFVLHLILLFFFFWFPSF